MNKRWISLCLLGIAGTLGIAACGSAGGNCRDPELCDPGAGPDAGQVEEPAAPEPDDEPACEAGASLGCVGDESTRCADDGSLIVREPCELGCNGSGTACAVCEPGVATCLSRFLSICSDDGAVIETEVCALGCAPSGDRCIEIEPSNNLGAYFDDARLGPDLVLAGSNSYIDTNTGEVFDGSGKVVTVTKLVEPNPGTPIRILAVRSIELGEGLYVSGELALGIVSYDDIVVTGEVIALAGASDDPWCAGQHGEVGSLGLSFLYAGGGGGSFSTRGGRGADDVASPTPRRTQPGAVVGNETLVPLRGGCPGGMGAAIPVGGVITAPGRTPGGAGGGAIQMVSRSRILIEAGGMRAPGTGGGSGLTRFPGENEHPGLAGGGGGSGGGILLEAPLVSLNRGTTIAANGGGGGCERGSGFGYYGTFADSSSKAGCAQAFKGGRGGRGSAQSDPAKDAEFIIKPPKSRGGGGGGGGLGRVRINSRTFIGSPGVTFSPTPSFGPIPTR